MVKWIELPCKFHTKSKTDYAEMGLDIPEDEVITELTLFNTAHIESIWVETESETNLDTVSGSHFVVQYPYKKTKEMIT